ncbi:hypothetical protein YH66_01005 [[Brevibacterium] flavum]|uniref:Uncharacterized protein n=1 Tax=[Brevibacterium] flavum TaxID=92706 RepID=A0A0F6Z3M5_9CORY|nr:MULTISPECIES: hypothetical protein [Corynebacterium]AKF26231.1 hypothetical protein YH66_01005 [[Brevibacterium] flavum]ANE07057.1 hypothetical protein A3654_00995 [Corynebacterium glutamicum]AST19466.1 hypothetical protein CEY17_01005 [Corynebacterium glutamicum ATCC 14067]KEI21913.1 hypothetical protein KIQ_004775 [Corynebacterium glutamicum ATCC 14067]KIH74758.1 hypothetical protein SD36_01095 [Corynebacterium glutamicum]
MAGKKSELVPRPRKKNEFEIRFATTHAAKGWRDLVASIRNHMAETWDFLTVTPLLTTPTNYRLKGELGIVHHNGKAHDRWQHKPTAKGSARIWLYVEKNTVFLEQVHTHHPNETK